MEYREFLESKRLRKQPSGFDPLWMPDFLFDFQKHLTGWSIGMGRAAIFADCGMGKGQPPDSLVLTPNGFVKMGELSIGDNVIASDGKSYPVKGVYPRRKQRVYRLVFSDRSSFMVDFDHLHICRTNNDRQRGKSWRIKSTGDLLRCGNLRYGKDGKSRNYDIPVVRPIEFSDERVWLISPYIVGVLLGDGCLRDNSVGLSSADSEILERVGEELPDGLWFKYKSGYDYRLHTGLTGNVRHPFRQNLIDLGMWNKFAYEKSVPKEYLFASLEDRLDVLRGLMDTDGYIAESGSCQFSSSSKRLADDVEFLVRSLGGIPTRSVKQTTHRDCYMVTFSLATFNPFHLSRKKSRWNPNPRDNGRWIDRIEPMHRTETVCIFVDSPDSSYVTEHFIVTHNTPMQLVWAENVARKTNKPVLILTPLAVSAQTVREGEKFGIEVRRTRQGRIRPGINVTNYERLHYFRPDDVAGVVCDESSILKNYDGKTRRRITDFVRTVPYRLLCTATPAPNDFMELGTSSEALGVMGRSQMLGMFFTNGGKSTQSWVLKGHAKKRFWQWMGAWARALRMPSDLGYEDGDFILPKLRMVQHTVPSGSSGGFFPKPAVTRKEQLAERRATLKSRCNKVAEIVPDDRPFVAWCHLNPEGDLLEKLIPDAVQVAGSDRDEVKEERLTAFAEGRIRVLVTKPKIASFGLNWQHCSDMSFFPSHSHEKFYQSLRRCYRFQQEREVTCNIVTSEAESRVLANMTRKERQAVEMYRGIVREMNDPGNRRGSNGDMKRMELPEWL